MLQQRRHSYQRFFNTPSVSNTSVSRLQKYHTDSRFIITEHLQFLRHRGVSERSSSQPSVQLLGPRTYQEEPERTRTDQEEPLGTRNNKNEPEWTTGNQNKPVGTRTDQKEPEWTRADERNLGQTRRDQGEPEQTTRNRKEPEWTGRNQNRPEGTRTSRPLSLKLLVPIKTLGHWMWQTMVSAVLQHPHIFQI